MRRAEKTNHPKQAPGENRHERCIAIIITSVSSLENDNEFIQFVCYIVAWARPLINSTLSTPVLPALLYKIWENLAAKPTEYTVFIPLNVALEQTPPWNKRRT